MTVMQRPLKAKVRDLVSLTKPRLTSFVLLSTLAGLYLGADRHLHLVPALLALAGTGLLAGGAAAINMLLERDSDKLMRRTEKRPLPGGRLSVREVLAFGIAITAAGLLVLALGVNLLTSFIGALTFSSYIFVYTPLKRLTPLNTLVGAVPGALPAVMGWTAARNALGVEAWVLFGLLFFWQLPHFLAIAWICREDYARAGIAMLPVFDRDGRLTARQVLNGSLLLLVVSLLPSFVGLAGPVYFAAALLSGLGLIALAISFNLARDGSEARRVFLGSLAYLPTVLAVLVLDRPSF